MRFANIRELKLETNKIMEEAASYGSVIVTRKGKPIALIGPISEDDISIKLGGLWPRLRASAESAGYGPKDVDALIRKSRHKKK
jgi:prevent-host-death family protein